MGAANTCYDGSARECEEPVLVAAGEPYSSDPFSLQPCLMQPCNMEPCEFQTSASFHRADNGRGVDDSEGGGFSRAHMFRDSGRVSNFDEIFGTGDLISKGSTGSVFAGRRHVSTRPVAIKTLPLDKFAAARRKVFEAETLLLAKLEHPNIARMFFSCREKERLVLVLEHCAGGELFDRISAQDRGLGEAGSRHLFRQMLGAVSYLHNLMIVHRDLKPENFLLLGQDGDADGQVVKLCDFGVAVHLADHTCRCMDKGGTLGYKAPEVHRRKGASLPADRWSLGVVLFIMLTGSDPFRHHGKEEPKEIVKNICAAHIATQIGCWQRLSEEARAFVGLFLVIEESGRTTCRSALEHSWMCGASTDEDQADPLARFSGPAASGEYDIATVLLELLERFASLELLQQILATVCARFADEATLFHDREIAAAAATLPWYEVFVALDCDMDGRLSCEELAAGLRAGLLRETGSAQTPWLDHFEVLARSLDVDQSGFVEWTEWVALAMLGRSTLDEDSVAAAFHALDAPSGDGEICSSDLARLLGAGEYCEQSLLDSTRMLRPWAPHAPSGSTSFADAILAEASPRLDLAATRHCLSRALTAPAHTVPRQPQSGAALCANVHSIPPLLSADDEFGDYDSPDAPWGRVIRI